MQIKLANIKLTDDERYLLLRDFETDRLDMKILSKNQDIFSVELTHNGKSLTDYMLDLRKKKEEESQAKTVSNETVVSPPPLITKVETNPEGTFI